MAAHQKVRIKDLKHRRREARRLRDHHQPMLDDVYSYCIPYRQTAGDGENERAKGEGRTGEIYDLTQVVAAFRFAGKIQRAISPVDGPMYSLTPGPLVGPSQGADVEKEMASALQNISNVTAAFNFAGDWDTALWEMGLEMNGGTGFMLMMEGPTPERPVIYHSPPASEMLIDEGGYGDVHGIFWTRQWALRAIKDQWPEAKFGPAAEKKLKENPEQKVRLCTDTVWSAGADRWIMTLWIDDQDEQPIIDPLVMRTCPWLTPRYYKVPGEVWGRGVANVAMPAIKTLNTAQSLMLMAAAIAMGGIYTAVDDGVFNPSQSQVKPMAIWKVRANGGVFGPSIQKLDPPDIRLGDLKIQDLRMVIKEAMLDDALPPQTGAVRSPTEIMERVKRLAADHQGAFGRLVREIVVPKAKRDIEIAWNKKLIGHKIHIDQLLVQVVVNSEVAIARMAAASENLVKFIELALSITSAAAAAGAPVRVDMVVKLYDALDRMARAMQVDATLLMTDKERAAKQQAEAQQAMAMAAVQAGAEGIGSQAGVDAAQAMGDGQQ